MKNLLTPLIILTAATWVSAQTDNRKEVLRKKCSSAAQKPRKCWHSENLRLTERPLPANTRTITSEKII